MTATLRANFLLAILLAVSSALAETPSATVFTFTGPKSALPAGWKSSDARRWRVNAGALCVDAMKGESYVVFGDPSWQNYEIEATAQFTAVKKAKAAKKVKKAKAVKAATAVKNETCWLAVVFRATGPGKAPWSQIPIQLQSTKSSDVEFVVRTASKRGSIRQVAQTKKGCRLRKPIRLRVVVRGTQVEAYVDGRLVIQNAYCVDRDTGQVGLAASGCKARFDNVRVRLLPSSPPHNRQPLRPCEVVAHRGFSDVAPENTLMAIDRAIAAGATGSEFDVYACRDGALVLMHDATVDRTTNGQGGITTLNLAELKRLDAGSWKSASMAGEPVPTLAEALARFKGTHCDPVVEIKMRGISRHVINEIRAADLLDRAIVIAFDGEIVRDIKTLAPQLKCAWLGGANMTGLSPAQRADRLAAAAQRYGTNILDLHYGMLSGELIAELHQRDITVWAWTVDDPQILKTLMRWGIDSITTNRPDLVVGLQKQQVSPAKRSHRHSSKKKRIS